MNYLAERGDVPRCYRMVLRNGNADTITKTMKLPYAGSVIHPSMKLEKWLTDIWRLLENGSIKHHPRGFIRMISYGILYSWSLTMLIIPMKL